MANVDWIKIKNEYINTQTSYRKLADKYKVSQQSVSRHGKDERWPKLKKERLSKTCAKVEQKLTEKIANAEVDRITSLLELSDEAQKQIRTSLWQLGKYVDMFGNVSECDVIDANKLRKLVASLKDLKDIISLGEGLSMSEEEKKQANLLKAIEKAVTGGNK